MKITVIKKVINFNSKQMFIFVPLLDLYTKQNNEQSMKISSDDQKYLTKEMSYKYIYITESHYNSTKWVRAIASRRSSTTNNSGPIYGVFLPVVISTLIRTSYVGSPLFQGSIIYNPSSSCSPTPLLASNHLFHRLKQVVARD